RRFPAAAYAAPLTSDLLAEPARDVVELLPWRGRTVVRRELDPEAVALPARDHMEVRVKDLLAGGRAVREKEVDRLAAQTGAAKGGGDPPRQRPHRNRRDLVDFADRRGVLARNDERVALRD